MRRYFITGGTGFIGRALVRQLLRRNDTEEVCLLTRRPPSSTPFAMTPRVSFWLGDIVNVRLPESKGHFTHLIHAAAEANDLLQPDQPRYYYTVAEGTKRVFEWARRKEIPNVLFVSSGIVVKDCDTVYCRAKRMGEFIGQALGLPMKIARVFSVVGEEMPLNGQYALGRFIYQAQVERRVSFYPSQAVRSYLHVDEVAQWLEAVMEKGDLGKPYDVGGNSPISITGLAKLVAAEWDIPVVSHSAPPRDSIYLPSLNESYADLGVRQWIDLPEALKRVRTYLERKERDRLEYTPTDEKGRPMTYWGGKV